MSAINKRSILLRSFIGVLLEYQIKAKFQVFIGSYLIDDICSAYLVNKHIDHSLYNTKFIPTVNWASNHLKESETI